MARYENNTTEQGMFLAIQLEDQFDENSREKIIKQFISDRIIVDQFDEYYRNDTKGRRIKNPKDVIAAILYGYITGNRSSRKIEHLLKHHIGFMYISNMLRIDHSVICEFKVKFEKEVENIFSDLLFVLNEMGAIDWRIIAGDGTKIKAYASKGKNIGKERTEKLLNSYRKMASDIIKRDLELERAEKSNGIDEKEYTAEKERIARQKRTYESVLNKIEEFRKDEDKKEILRKDYCNLTDPESKLMVSSGRDHYIQGYNTLLMVSNNDIIVDYDTITLPEKKYTKQMVERVEKLKAEAGIKDKPSKYLFDGGFQDMKQILELSDAGLDMYVGTKEKDFSGEAGKRKNFKLVKDKNDYCLVCRGKRISKGNYNKKADQHTFWFYRKGCEKCTFYQDCYKNIKKTTIVKTITFSGFELRNRDKIDQYLDKMRGEGKKIYNRRIGKEHVNANLKTQKNYFQTFYRGIKKVKMDNCWAILSHNMNKYCQYKEVNN